jgi:anti-sigma factor ChrR (cupin superfamily)
MTANPLDGPASPTPKIFEWPKLLQLAGQVDSLAWRPFREGVDIFRLYGDGLVGPSASILRFREATQIPLHHHDGYEHILVLAGSQRDEHGVVEAGTLRIHPPGTSHQVFGEAGCLVLAIYEKPVRFDVPEAHSAAEGGAPD